MERDMFVVGPTGELRFCLVSLDSNVALAQSHCSASRVVWGNQSVLPMA